MMVNLISKGSPLKSMEPIVYGGDQDLRLVRQMVLAGSDVPYGRDTPEP